MTSTEKQLDLQPEISPAGAAGDQRLSHDDEKGDNVNGVYADAKMASDLQHSMTIREAIRLYPKAIAWSVLISSTIIMEGYQVCLVSNFYAMPAFQAKYGQLQPDGTRVVTAPWQAGLSNGAQCGEIIGLFLNGWLSERFGYKKVLLVCLALVTAFITIFFTAPNIQTLLVGEILCGIPWGVFQTLTISYAADVMPVALRSYLTAYVNFCWGAGQLVGIGLIKSQLGRTDEWAYKIPYAVQWIWPVPLFCAILFAPESPWWLVRHHRLDDALHSLSRLSAKSDPHQTLAMIQHTTALESQLTKGASYWDCFKGVNLRRTEIVCAVWAAQILSGNGFSNYSTYFLEQAGLDSSTSYSFALGQYAINSVGTIVACSLMAIGIGRRTLYLGGLSGLCTTLLVIGFLGLVPNKTQASLATGALMIVWAMFYQCTVGTVAYSLVAELSTRRLQVKTIVIGRNVYNVAAILSNILTPYMLNQTAWNWKQFAGFFWGGSCFLCVVYCYFRLPEPRGRTFAEIDVLFERKTPARKFATTEVDPFEADVRREIEEQKETVTMVERA